MSFRRRAPWLIVLVAIVTVAGVLPAGAADPPTYRPQEELTASWSWRPCRGGECARLPVPLSYTAKRTRLIRIAVFRKLAGSPMLRRGALLINPGGPGASGIDAARYLSSVLPASITRSFDIEGWDPRGTGASDSIDCGERLDYLFTPDTAPDTPAERTALEAASARFSKACARRSGDLLGHVSSRDTVEDMEEIRSALGVDRKSTRLNSSHIPLSRMPSSA